jgi:hypothetical protein
VLREWAIKNQLSPSPLRVTSVYAAHAHAIGSMPIAPYIVAIYLIP